MMMMIMKELLRNQESCEIQTGLKNNELEYEGYIVKLMLSLHRENRNFGLKPETSYHPRFVILPYSTYTEKRMSIGKSNQQCLSVLC